MRECLYKSRHGGGVDNHGDDDDGGSGDGGKDGHRHHGGLGRGRQTGRDLHIMSSLPDSLVVHPFLPNQTSAFGIQVSHLSDLWKEF